MTFLHMPLRCSAEEYTTGFFLLRNNFSLKSFMAIVHLKFLKTLKFTG